MAKTMNRIDKLFLDFCPNGVEFKKLGEVILLQKGKQLNKELLSENGTYPAYNGGISYSGFTESYNYNENTIIISQGGASAGFVNFVTTKFYANAHCYVVLPKLEIVINRYVYHFLKWNQQKLTERQHGAGIPALRTSEILSLIIPIPPLAIQEEIVTILDSFTEIEAEIEAEIKARKKQYEYYRDELLTFDGAIGWRSLDESCISITAGGDLPKNYKKGQTKPSPEFPYPIFANAVDSSGLYGYTDSYKIEYDAVTISARGAKVGFHTVREGKFTPIIRLLSLVPNKEIILTKFLNYILDLTPIAGTKGGIPQLTVPTVKKLKIPIPPIKEQKRIISILDKFDALVNDTSIGLPAELKARRKQYEYYREKLLTFKELEKQHD